MVCKGICIKYIAQKPPPTIGRYTVGQKRCQICAIFIECDRLRCPCCGTILRTKSRGRGLYSDNIRTTKAK
jgi:hypothetical protein